MSKGHHNKRDEYKKVGTAGHYYHKSELGRRSIEEPAEKRPSVFDRLGTKGVTRDRSRSTSKSKGLFPDRSRSTNESSANRKRTEKKHEKHRGHKYREKKLTSRRRGKESPKTSDDDTSSEDDSTSTSQSSSTTESSSSSTAATTTSSSSVPSVQIRHRKKHAGENVQFENDFRLEQKQKRYAPTDRERNTVGDRHGQAGGASNPRPESSSLKRKAAPNLSQLENWKQAKYEAPESKSQTPPLRRTPVDDNYNKGRGPMVGKNSGNRDGTESDRGRNRIRIVPSNYGGGRPAPSDMHTRYSSPMPSSRSDSRNFPTADVRSGRSERRPVERLAPARTPTRSDRIPPLLPECELRRQPFPHLGESQRGFIANRQPPPLLPDLRRELPSVCSPLKPTGPKVEEISVKNRVAEWVGETINPPKKIKADDSCVPSPLPATPLVLPPVEEILSEISDFEDSATLPSPAPPPSEKEDLEVTSTLVDDAAGRTAVEPTGEVTACGDSLLEDSILDNMDFEEISDDELDDSGALQKKQGIVDALGVDWSILLRGKDDPQVAKVPTSSSTRRRRESSVVELLKRTGLHRSLVSDELFNKVLTRLRDIETEAGVPVDVQTNAEELQKPCLRRRRLQRQELVERLGLGPGSRALTYRRDLAMRYQLLGFESLPLENLEAGVTLPVLLENTL